MSESIDHQISSRRAACKQWSVFLAVAILLVGALGRLAAVSVLWAAAPLLLLGLVDAAYAAEQRHHSKLTHKANPAGAAFLQRIGAVFSPSIWPFYLGLFAIVVGGAFNLPPRETLAQIASAPLVGPAATFPQQPYSQTSNGPVQPQMFPQRMPNGSPLTNQPSANPGLPRSITVDQAA